MNEKIKLFKALGQETRYLIIKKLLSGEKCACEIPKLIKRTQSNTSMHLAILLKLGIVKQRREGKKIIYSIKNDCIKKIFKLINEDICSKTLKNNKKCGGCC